MSLRVKIALIGLPLFLVLFAALHVAATNVLVRSFDRMEADTAVYQATSVLRVLSNARAQLLTHAEDWASWDDTYRFVEDRNKEYVVANLGDGSFETLRISLMAFLDTHNRVVYVKAFDAEKNVRMPVSPGMARMLREHAEALVSPDGLSGLVATDEGAMIVCTRPILTSDREGPSRGTLVFCRLLTPKVVRDLQAITNTEFTLMGGSSGRAPGRGVTEHSLPSGEALLIDPVDDERLIANVRADDIYGAPSILVQVQMARTIHLQGVASLRLLDLSLALVGIVFSVISFLVTDRLFLRRLRGLQGELENVDTRCGISKRMTTAGGDEISTLAIAVNELLDGLQQYENRDRAILGANPDIMVVFSPDGIVQGLHAPNELQRTVLPADYVGKSVHDLLSPEEAKEALRLLAMTLETDEVQFMEFEIYPHYRSEPQQHEARIASMGDGNLLVILRNRTREKAAEASMRMQTSAMNAASDQIVIADRDGAIEFINLAFERASGYLRDEIMGKPAADFLTPKGRNPELHEYVWSEVREGRTWHGEIVCERKDGTYRAEDMTITPVLNDAGVIEHFIAINRDVTEQKMYEAKLDLLAHHDALTGLPNRLLFSDRLNRRLAEARRKGEQVAVMFMDMDRFKLVNDTLGHSSGDRLLRLVGERLGSAVRESDIVARMGGDEFTVALSQDKRMDEASRAAQRILDLLAEPFHLEDRDLYVTASIGISVCPTDGDDVETLVRNADTAMYQAKERGKNTFHFYTEALNAAAVERMTLEAGLRKAVEQGDLVAYYQPCVDIRGGRILSVEALVRWRRSDSQLIMPDQFIPVAEETGLIVPIGDWMLRQACEQTKSWYDEGVSRIRVGVNISAKQFQFVDLAEVVRAVLDEAALSPECLILELTESALMQNPDHAVRVLRRLKKLGVKIYIDDFGTGYSSLSHLKCFPIDAVKIDRSFVRNITSDADDAAIAGAIVAMAHSLKLQVIAEGVETVAQLEFLRSLDCDQLQGYFVSRPGPAEDMTQLLLAENLLPRDPRVDAAA